MGGAGADREDEDSPTRRRASLTGGGKRGRPEAARRFVGKRVGMDVPAVVDGVDA